MYIAIKLNPKDGRKEGELDITKPTAGKVRFGISDKRKPEFNTDVVVQEGKLQLPSTEKVKYRVQQGSKINGTA